jgi:hypothetical protein
MFLSPPIFRFEQLTDGGVIGENCRRISIQFRARMHAHDRWGYVADRIGVTGFTGSSSWQRLEFNYGLPTGSQAEQ